MVQVREALHQSFSALAPRRHPTRSGARKNSGILMEDAGAGWSFGFFTTFAPHTLDEVVALGPIVQAPSDAMATAQSAQAVAAGGAL